MPSPSSKGLNQVNDLLHALRGEQFRRAQNAKGSKRHLKLASLPMSGSRGLSSLPKGLSKVDYDIDPIEAFASLRLASTSSRRPRLSGEAQYAGPVAPKSWIVRTPDDDGDVRSTPEWRAEALSLIFLCNPNSTLSPAQNYVHNDHHNDGGSNDRDLSASAKKYDDTPALPSLTLLCLRYLLSLTSSSEFVRYIVPYLPSHLRRLLVRDAAVRSPLPDPSLFALCDREGHIAGELIVVGPAASLPEGYFQRNARSDRSAYGGGGGGGGEDEDEDEKDLDQLEDWDTEDMFELLHALVLVSTPLTSSTLLRFPPTITNLALICLPASIPLYRLPGVCPLLEILDLSYNAWLAEGAQDAPKFLDSVDWGRWAGLRILGLRGCYIPEGTITKLNKGRWEDVQVVR